jgi:archaellum component FlaF (FlaF/FlaG flagellin family)
MVAVILLIAFTIAIGGILSVWFTGLVRITGGPAEATAEKVAKCAPVHIRIEEVRSQNITNITVIASNPSSIDITGIRIAFDGYYVTAFPNLEAGSTNTYLINVTNVTGNLYPTNLTSVSIRGLCLGEIPIEDTCSKGYICWKV